MATVTAASISVSDSLERFRQEFNTLRSDVSNITSGNITINNESNNRILTSVSTNTFNAEESLTFDGSTFAVGGAMTVSGLTTLSDDVTFTGASYNAVWDKSDNALEFADNAKAVFGAGSDLEILHNGAYSLIKDGGAGNLVIAAGDLQVTNPGVTENLLRAYEDGQVELYHDNAIKLSTTSGGINVTGTVTDDGATHDGDVTFTGASYNVVWDKSDNALEFVDNAKIQMGTSSDLSIYHDGSHSYIQDGGTGYLLLTSNGPGVRINSSTAEVMGDFVPNGAVSLYHDNNLRLATSNVGVSITGNIVPASADGGRLGQTD